MTKADIIDIVFDKVGYSKKDVTVVIEDVFECIKSELESGENVKLSGFGNFTIRQKRARRGRNPQTGDEIVIDKRRVMTFKASQILKKAVNAGAPQPAKS
ncbi:MAG: integration host factor subunit alpha [Deltaproteobacteria bacterium RIFCSPLOWO2_02_FULL_53_8]|nr:MAG: integration host factor subunit alpha [Deltaproteobacteria bacterium RIFCSPLOWO2_02_FULL_53_8]